MLAEMNRGYRQLRGTDLCTACPQTTGEPSQLPQHECEDVTDRQSREGSVRSPLVPVPILTEQTSCQEIPHTRSTAASCQVGGEPGQDSGAAENEGSLAQARSHCLLATEAKAPALSPCARTASGTLGTLLPPLVPA